LQGLVPGRLEVVQHQVVVTGRKRGLARILEGAVQAHWFAVIVPVVTLASMLPVSLGGAGVREMLYVYANVAGIAVSKGTSVSRGQKIAEVREGDPSFLHFEVRQGFESVDPVPYLTD